MSRRRPRSGLPRRPAYRRKVKAGFRCALPEAGPRPPWPFPVAGAIRAMTGTWSDGPPPAAGFADRPRRHGAVRQGAASPRYGRAGGPCRRPPSRRRGSSTRCRASPPPVRNAARRRPSRPRRAHPRSRAVSTGVWLTTRSSCLCDHTSVSSGAMLRSPTRIALPVGLDARQPAAHLVEEGELVARISG